MQIKKQITTGITLIFIAVLSGIFMIYISGGLFVHNLELKTLDWRFVVRGEKVPVSDKIKIIAIDEKSFEEIDELFSLWPSLITDVAEKIVKNDAKVVGIDFLLSKSIDKYIPGETKKLQKVLLSEKVVLISVLKPDGEVKYPYDRIRAIAEPDNIGLGNAAPDIDEIVRRQPIYLDDPAGIHHPCFPFVLLSKYLEGEIHQEKDGRFRIADTVIKDEKGYITINYAGPPGRFNTISFFEVLEKARNNDNQYFKNNFKDKIVIIGRTDFTGKDVFKVPFSTLSGKGMSGIEIHANTINTVLQKDYITYIKKLYTIIIIFIFCLFITFICYYTRPFLSISISLGVIVVYAAAAFQLFTHQGIILDIVTSSASVPVVFGITYVYRYLTIDRKMKQVRNIFSKMVSPQVEEELWKENISTNLGEGEKREVTVLFSDINDFSNTCDKHEDPTEVMEMLNSYFVGMVDIVFDNRGTVKQFVGDEIMAIYGAPADEPEQAFLALKTAVEMIDKLKEMKEKSKGKKGFYETKIGIHTGEMKLGFIGSSKRMEYTTIGKNVNQAARLEALNKTFDPGSPLLSDEDILDWNRLIMKLKDPDNEAIKRVKMLLNEDCRKLIDNWTSDLEYDKIEKDIVINSFNELLENRELFDKNTFKNIQLNQATQKLVSKGLQQLTKEETEKLNRLLLEAIFSLCINKKYKSYILVSDVTHEKLKKNMVEFRNHLPDVVIIKLQDQKLKGFEEKKVVYKVWKKGW